MFVEAIALAILRVPILKPLVFKIDWNGDELIVGKGEDFGVNLSNSASIVDQLPLNMFSKVTG